MSLCCLQLDRKLQKKTLHFSQIQTAPSEAAEKATQVPVQDEQLNTCLATPQEGNTDTRHHKSPSHNRKNPNTSGDQCLNKTFDILTASPNQVHDENHHFGNLVASKLRNYDDRVRSLIQNDILNVFVRANRGCYNTVPPSPGDSAAPGLPPNHCCSHTCSHSLHS